MGDLGLAGSFGAAGAAEGLDEVLARRIAAKHYADVLQQQAIENAFKARQLDQTDALRRDTLAETTRQHDLQDEEKRIGFANTLGDQLPANTALAPSDPAVGMLRAGGRGSLLTHQDANLPSTQNSEVLGLGNKAPLPTGGFLRTKSAGNPEQYLKQASAKQQDTEADNKRQADQAAETNRHNQAMEQKPPTDHFGFLQTYDENGKPSLVLRTNSANGGVSPVQLPGGGAIKPPPGAAAAAQEERTKKDALDTLSQLDQAVENARSLIGPGHGRVSSVEQMIGNADPRIQALGVKMKAAKMRVDHALTGSTRAGASPSLLKQWDNILANNITPEGLKGGVQAMREIIGGQTAGPTAPLRVYYDAQGNPIKQ